MKIHKLLNIILVMCILIPFTVGCSSFKNTEIKSMIPSLGCTENHIKSKSSSNNTMTFELKKGDKVKFTYDSNVEEGTLKIQLICSKDDVIEDFPINESGTKEIVIDQDKNCMVSVNYDNFIGNYKMYVDKIK